MVEKFTSRKFIVFILNFIAFVFLSYYGKISYEIVLALIINAIIYLFVEGVLDLRRLKVMSEKFEIEATNEKESEDI